MRCSWKAVSGTLQACIKYILSAPIFFSIPMRASRGTSSLKGHLHTMAISNSASQLGTASKAISRKCVVVGERMIWQWEQYARLPNVEARGYVKSSVRVTWKEKRMFLVLKAWGLQLTSQLYGFLTTSKNNSPCFLTSWLQPFDEFTSSLSLLWPLAHHIQTPPRFNFWKPAWKHTKALLSFLKHDVGFSLVKIIEWSSCTDKQEEKMLEDTINNKVRCLRITSIRNTQELYEEYRNTLKSRKERP